MLQVRLVTQEGLSTRPGGEEAYPEDIDYEDYAEDYTVE
jgi:hypothetical protein